MNHYTFETFINYLEETLPTSERKKLQAHLVDCPTCSQELEDARLILGDLEMSGLSAPAENLIARVVSAFRRKQERSLERPPRTATLQFDSWVRLFALGVRGIPQERQFLYSEGSIDLDLQLTQDDMTATFILQGQILDSASTQNALEGIEVWIINSGEVAHRGLTDHLGQFSFTHLTPDIYTLRVLFADHDMLLEDINLKNVKMET